MLYYLHTDHLGSASLTTDASGNIHAQQRYFPYGETRWSSAPLPTDRQFTGQRREAALGIYDYKARFYSPRLGRFLSADTIVPGAADSAGGGAATLGYSEQTRLTPLTVGFHETQFLDILNSENRELLQYGPPALWDRKVRQEHTVPMGPANPQALNRYAYCLGNPLRYVDPTGHYILNYIDVHLTANQVQTLLNEISWWLNFCDTWVDNPQKLIETISLAWGATESLQLLSPTDTIFFEVVGNLIAPEIAIPTSVATLGIGFGIDFTKDDLQDLRYALAMASEGGTKGIHLRMGSDIVKWGIEVNGTEVVGHFNLGHPLITPKGTLNATQSFMMIWNWYYGW